MDTSSQESLRPILRQLIQQVLQETRTEDHQSEKVRISDSSDLTSFAIEIATRALNDPNFIDSLKTGKKNFTLDDRTMNRQRSDSIDNLKQVDPAVGSKELVESGVVTEKLVGRIASENKRLVLRKRVVITPLAKEMIRSKGIRVEVLEQF